jgi:MazG family protein
MKEAKRYALIKVPLYPRKRSRKTSMDSEDNNPDRPDLGAGHMDRAVELVRYLRVECPWDRKQTPESLVPHLLEEAHEVADAIRESQDDDLEGELGDLLLNLAFQVVLGEERGAFTAASVMARLEKKMWDRHPHLFGLGEKQDWEALKAKERREKFGEEGASVLAGIPAGMDPLHKAHRIQDRVSGVGFDWEDATGALEKVHEEVGEVRDALKHGDFHQLEEELGDLLFAMVNLVRLAGSHSSTALDHANRKFSRRFERLETMAAELGISIPDAPLDVLDQIWDEVKIEEG